ncbi:MAG: hypothetical protein KME06_18560 [Kastovskya adunca ATA6-11-RM4]|jgi:hypothetical protein|nr:hypothetical protein [Kastovskya adunca ATA6-11-RM4]
MLRNSINVKKMNSRKKILSVATIIILIIIGFGLVKFGFREISRSQSSCGDYGFINTPCSQLPTIAGAEKVLNEHKSKVNQIKNVNPNFITVEVQESNNCAGKGIILISHPSENDCDSLKKILGKNFWGIPYKIINN